MNRFRTAVISCGMISRSAHIPAFLKFSDFYELVAVCDINLELAKETSERYHIPGFYSDAEEMLEKEKPDVVSVCVGNMLHKSMVMLALKYGANVICEKPLAFRYSDAVEMYSYAKCVGRTLTACQTLRYMPERLAAKRLIDSGMVGDIYHCDFSRIRTRGIPNWGKFHIKSHNGGGSFLDIGVHALDSAIWLIGNPKPLTVTASMHKVHEEEIVSAKQAGAFTGENVEITFKPEDMDVESFSSGYITFENGVGMMFKSAWAANLPGENNIIIAGKKLGINTEKHELYCGTEPIKPLELERDEYEGEPFFGHYHIIGNFAAYLCGREELMVKPEETINVSLIIDAAYRSSELGRTVETSEIILESKEI